MPKNGLIDTHTPTSNMVPSSIALLWIVAMLAFIVLLSLIGKAMGGVMVAVCIFIFIVITFTIMTK